jgi:hypothetical protein
MSPVQVDSSGCPGAYVAGLGSSKGSAANAAIARVLVPVLVIGVLLIHVFWRLSGVCRAFWIALFAIGCCAVCCT